MSNGYHHNSCQHPPPEHRATGEQKMMGSLDPVAALGNLAAVRTRMDSLQRFLGDAISRNTLLSKDDMDSVSSELASAIHQVVVNGAALLSFSQPDSNPNPNPNSTKDELKEEELETVEAMDDIDDDDDVEIVELDAVELLAEHIHFCEICGKGFKRDANLRMHMRAHGNQFKTAEALAKSKPSSSTATVTVSAASSRRFSCPYQGCNRNQKHPDFRSLKSVVCVKNHFKRSHCPKIYSCNRCHKKSFSVLADLKSHLKNCGLASSRWKCSCGTTFSRKDKLFGHIALFDGHMPAHDKDNPNPKELELEEEFLLDDICFQDFIMSNTSASASSSADLSSSLMDQFFNF